jgi:hypothetical protein
MARTQVLTGAAQPVSNSSERAREFLRNHPFGTPTPSALQWLDKRRPKDMLLAAAARRGAEANRQEPEP